MTAADAEHWDRWYAEADPYRTISSAYQQLRLSMLLQAVRARHFRHLCELGCGEAYFLSRVARQCEQALGVDISGKAVVRARERCSGLPHVQIEVGDLRAFHAPADAFDCVVAIESLYYFEVPTLLDIARRIHSSLQPGGIFLADIRCGPEFRPQYRALAEFIGKNYKLIRRRVSSHRLSVRLDGHSLGRSIINPLAFALARLNPERFGLTIFFLAEK